MASIGVRIVYHTITPRNVTSQQVNARKGEWTMLILIALLVLIWFVCVNAILIDAEAEAENNKRKFELYANSDNLKFYPLNITGNGKCSEQDFFEGDI